MRNYFLQTGRIGFSHWKKTDDELAQKLWGEDSVSRYIASGGILSEKDIQKRLQTEIENQLQHEVQYYPIFDKSTGELIGCCGLRPYDLANNIYEIGFHLRSNYWGQGFAFEAANAMISYAFGILHAAGLFAGHHPGNTASMKLLQKLGFGYIGDKYYDGTGLYHPSYKLSPNK